MTLFFLDFMLKFKAGGLLAIWGAPLRSARFYLNHQQLLSHIHINHIHINHIRISHTRISVDLPNKLSTKSTANRAV